MRSSTLIDNDADEKEFIELNTEAKANGDATTSTTSPLQESSSRRHDMESRGERLNVQLPKRKIVRNFCVLCMTVVFLFTGFVGVSILQTSLNREKGIGSTSLSLLYASMIFSCFLPKFLIARLGCKTTLTVSMIGYIMYIAANFYAVQATMFTAAIFIGVASGPFWTATFSYITQIGVWYAKLTNQDKKVAISQFFGVFWLFNQSCQIWGNLLSSLVFAPTPSQKNETFLDDPACGAQFCGDNNISAHNFKQETENVYTVVGIYVGCSIIAMLIVAILMDPITLDNEDTEENKKLNPKLLLATIRHLYKSPIQMMLVAITIYGGMEKAFVGGDFTKAYISCSLGIWNLGYVMICYGVVGALCSLLFGNLVKYVGRIPFFVLLFVVHGGLQIVLLVWEPKKDEVVLFYVFAGLWGVGSMVISTQLNSLYGELFTEKPEVAFSNYKLCEATGYAVTYAYNDALCTDTKLYICMALLCLGMMGYISAEVTSRRDKRKKTKFQHHSGMLENNHEADLST